MRADSKTSPVAARNVVDHAAEAGGVISTCSAMPSRGLARIKCNSMATFDALHDSDNVTSYCESLSIAQAQRVAKHISAALGSLQDPWSPFGCLSGVRLKRFSCVVHCRLCKSLPRKSLAGASLKVSRWFS